jgi:hypothetical protein
VNIERLTQLRDVLAALPDERFDMSTFGQYSDGKDASGQELLHNCGTVACIAGWAAAIFAEPGITDGAAARTLNLDPDLAHDLFFADDHPLRSHGLAAITRSDAVKTLTHLIETGEVKWGL